MNLLLLNSSEIDPNGEVLVTGTRAEHIFCVLHAQPGDHIRAGLLNGGTGSAEILSVSRTEVRLRATDFSGTPPPARNFLPVIAMPRPQSFKKTLHFIASSGMRKAVFIGSSRVEKSYWKSQAAQPDAIREELILGLEQGCCTMLPEIQFRPSLRAFLESGDLTREIQSGTRALVAHPVRAAQCPAQCAEKIVCAIGPEGGFLEPEVESLEHAGFERVEIGPYILRVEFALSFLCGRLSP